ncbi:MAG: hypothetical protein KKH83_04555, partial [Candidatus Margulisbacteria bacterium]|nr:hypothetical protein [Candidatus Margulisiibacteriota bacterium]
ILSWEAEKATLYSFEREIKNIYANLGLDQNETNEITMHIAQKVIEKNKLFLDISARVQSNGVTSAYSMQKLDELAVSFVARSKDPDLLRKGLQQIYAWQPSPEAGRFSSFMSGDIIEGAKKFTVLLDQPQDNANTIDFLKRFNPKPFNSRMVRSPRSFERDLLLIHLNSIRQEDVKAGLEYFEKVFNSNAPEVLSRLLTEVIVKIKDEGLKRNLLNRVFDKFVESARTVVQHPSFLDPNNEDNVIQYQPDDKFQALDLKQYVSTVLDFVAQAGKDALTPEMVEKMTGVFDGELLYKPLSSSKPVSLGWANLLNECLMLIAEFKNGLKEQSNPQILVFLDLLIEKIKQHDNILVTDGQQRRAMDFVFSPPQAQRAYIESMLKRSKGNRTPRRGR